MKSIRLSKALSQGNVRVRTGRSVVGQIVLKFRPGQNAKDRLISAYPLKEMNNPDTYINLSKMYSSEQLMNSNLEDHVLRGNLELL